MGSRMMPLKNDEAAALGLPGRTVTVIRRAERPSMKPLRVQSAISCSHISLCVPYEVCGVGSVSSATTSGRGRPGSGPNTATELENTKRGALPAAPFVRWNYADRTFSLNDAWFSLWTSGSAFHFQWYCVRFVSERQNDDIRDDLA